MLAIGVGIAGGFVGDKLAYKVLEYLTQDPAIASIAVAVAEVVRVGVLAGVLAYKMRGRERLEDHISRVGDGVTWEVPHSSFVVGGVFWRR